MLEFFRTYSRALMFVLVPLIIGSFVFVGVENYAKLHGEQGATVAKVAGQAITQSQWDAALRQAGDNQRRQNPKFDLKQLETPQMKQQVLDALVLDHVVQAATEQSRFYVTDEQLLRAYQTDPTFAQVRQPDGSINKPLLEDLLAGQRLTVPAFEASLRQSMALRRVFDGITGTNFSPVATAARAFDAVFEQREFQLERFEAKDYLNKVSLSEAELATYYQDPKVSEQFKTKEQVDIEYVLLDLATIEKAVTVAPDDLKKYYDANDKRFTAPAERRSSHILIKAAGKDQIAAARVKAQGFLDELKKSPERFAEIAKKNSEDVSSAQRGGDNEIFYAQGDTDPAYEKALFALNLHQISELVETAEGFYIMRLDAQRGGEKRPFDAVKTEIEQTLAQPLIKQRIDEATKEFTNLAYEQFDSLKPLAEKFKLDVLSAKGIMRTPDLNPDLPWSSAPFLEQLFSKDVLSDKHNTEAVTFNRNKLVCARVLSHRPAAVAPLEAVHDAVQAQLKNQRAQDLARQAGQARLKALLAAPATVLAASAQVVSRANHQGLPSEVLDAVLEWPKQTLPAITGVDLKASGGGYAVIKLSKVLPERDPLAADAQKVQAQYAGLWARAEEKAYAQALKARFKTKILVPSAPASAADAAQL